MKPPPVTASPTAWRVGCAASLALAAVVLWHFHDRTWFAPDDGSYAAIAQRMLHGETLYGDIGDMHPGYIHFINAAAMKLFGERIVSMRYPLMLSGLLNALFAYLMLARRGVAFGFAGSAAMSCLTLVLYENPTAHWYALTLALAISWMLANVPPDAKWRLLMLGFLLGATFLMRQLTGVWVGMGMAWWLLYETGLRQQGKPRIARTLIALMTAVLFWYALTKTDALTWIMYLPGPFVLLLWLFRHARAGDAAVLRLLAELGMGALCSAIPLFCYLAGHGVIADWWHNITASAFSVTTAPFVHTTSFLLFTLSAIQTLLGMNPPHTFDSMLSGLFWLAATLVTPLLSFGVWRALRRKGPEAALSPLTVMGVFYIPVGLHLQTWIYLFMGLGLPLLALLWLWQGTGRLHAALSATLALLLSLDALHVRAGYPSAFTRNDMVAGIHSAALPCPQIERLGIAIGPEECAFYRHTLDIISLHSRPGDPILALPSDAQFYFLSGRRNPTAFFNATVGILSDADLHATLSLLRKDPPRMLLYVPDHPYDQGYAHRLMEALRPDYTLLGRVDDPTYGNMPLEIYLPRGNLTTPGRAR